MNRQTMKKLFSGYLITVVVVWALLAVLFATVGPPDSDRPAIAFVVFPIAAAIMLALLYLMIGIGIFVYRDAGKRGMEPLVWVIVAVLIPYFIGLIAYLLVRQPILVTCPSCGGRAGSDASFCPTCGKELKLLCAKCNQPMVGQARFCSHCGAEGAAS